MKYYNPNLSDSVVDYTDDQLNSKINNNPNTLTQAQILANSGYVPYTGAAGGNLGLTGNSSANISQGSDNIRNNINTTKSDASNLYSDITDTEASTTIDSLKASLGLQDVNGVLSDAEQQRIDQAGISAGREFDPIIADATESKRAGMPKSLIRGGEKGGLMSTQIAGAAALDQTVGNTWVGAGGELENIQSAYDKNITDLQAKKQQAITLAKQKAEEAIRTGRKSSNDQAVQLFSLAQEANKQSLDLIAKREEILSNRTKNIQDKNKYNLDFLNTLSKAGQPLSATQRTDIDTIFGSGFADKYYMTINEEDAVKKATDIIDLLAKVPIGKEIKIGDETYSGIKDDGETQIFSETDAQGNVTFLTLNKKTGEVIGKASGGKVGKPQSSSNGNGPTNDTKFWTEVDGARNELQQGEPWGNVWSRIKQQFPNKTDAEIDNALGTSWRETGAYQEWAKSKKVTTEDTEYSGIK